MRQQRYGFGVLLVIVGSVFLSTNGIMLRNIEQADAWQVLFFRGIAFSITVFLILLLHYRAKTKRMFLAIGQRGVWAGVALGLASFFYVFALMHTTVANAVFIIGSAPLATALVAWVMLGERMSTTGIVTMFVSLSGIGLLFADSIIDGQWFGNVMALGVVVTFIIYLMILRDNLDIDMLPAACLAGMVMAIVGFAGAENLSITAHDMALSVAMGCVQLTVGFMCYTIATRHILAAQVAFFALIETILSPIWVWIGVGETPSQLAMVGIVIVLVSVTVYSVMEMAKEERSL
ncbi:MAG: DMT family transporter [Proteobacteria bacterium]|nr:DMT family transporter [Pseudomonadota bacterium]